MNAKEAASRAEEVRTQREADQIERARKAAITAATNQRRERIEFVKELRNRIQFDIDYAVKEGKRKTEVGITGGHKSPVAAQNAFENHKHIRLIRAEIRRVEAEGYKVETIHGSTTYRTNHESSVPDYDWYEYDVHLKITW